MYCDAKVVPFLLAVLDRQARVYPDFLLTLPGYREVQNRELWKKQLEQRYERISRILRGSRDVVATFQQNECVADGVVEHYLFSELMADSVVPEVSMYWPDTEYSEVQAEFMFLSRKVLEGRTVSTDFDEPYHFWLLSLARGLEVPSEYRPQHWFTHTL
jgi:hypothetical protein